MNNPPVTKVRADFNGLFGELLCLSHKDTCEDADGNRVNLREGMIVTAFDEDVDKRSPRWFRRNGSRWVLRIDQRGVRHESDLKTDA